MKCPYQQQIEVQKYTHKSYGYAPVDKTTVQKKFMECVGTACPFYEPLAGTDNSCARARNEARNEN